MGGLGHVKTVHGTPCGRRAGGQAGRWAGGQAVL